MEAAWCGNPGLRRAWIEEGEVRDLNLVLWTCLAFGIKGTYRYGVEAGGTSGVENDARVNLAWLRNTSLYWLMHQSGGDVLSLPTYLKL